MRGPIETDVAERLAAVDARDGDLRAFIRVDAAEARAAARAADQAEPPADSPLHGLIVAVKDNLAVAGKPWTAGVHGRRGLIAHRDAHAVARLKMAGAIVLGGLNMEEGALGAVTDNPVFGRCINPLGEGLTPGGSSGGSAAAVAAGFVDLALGTDTMGSVRIPAAYCGLCGLKPTFGLVGRSGMAFLAPSLDTIGPLARQADLLWPATFALAGLDPEDGDSRPAPANWAVRPNVSLAGVRLGVPSSLAKVDLEPAVRAGFERACAAAGAAGAAVDEVSTEGWDPGASRRAGLLLAEAEGAVEMADLLETPGALSDSLAKLLGYGVAAPSARLVAAGALVRTAAAACDRALAEVDALLMPTAPQRAFAHGVPAPANQADLTALANFSGTPAAALPVPGEVLPASVQLQGPRWSEARLTAWAEALEAALA